ncbi:MAG: hypothetical protein LBE22_06065 [Azoarcus sp.]|jgi:hypothetical protein|nr:hypothetical protein [Azoarcus sp.]
MNAILLKRQVEHKQAKKWDLKIPLMDRPVRLLLIAGAVFIAGFITKIAIISKIQDTSEQYFGITTTAHQLSLLYAQDVKKADSMFRDKRFTIIAKVNKVNIYKRGPVIPISSGWEWRWREPTVIVEVDGVLAAYNPWLKGFTEEEGRAVQPGEMIIASCVGDSARGEMSINEKCRLLQYNLPASPRAGGTKRASRIRRS